MRGEISDFRTQLLDWFDRCKRDLPWRSQPSLYRTVVSEFMLQQTQVETVLPYFDRWMDRFPDFSALALATESEVLQLWQGLGYYARARNLHLLAKQVHADGAPLNAAGWQKLRGIGPYTAAAISSINQKQPVPVVDGNVVRVLSRITNNAQPIRSAEAARRRFTPLAERLVDPLRPGAFNEAIMELGATICKKSAPACLICPVRSHCVGCADGKAAELPVIERIKTVRRTAARAWCLDNGRILLHQYPSESKRLAGLLELPLIDTPKYDQEPILIRSRGIANERIQESVYIIPSNHPVTASPLARWVATGDLSSVAISGPHLKWIGVLLG